MPFIIGYGKIKVQEFNCLFAPGLTGLPEMTDQYKKCGVTFFLIAANIIVFIITEIMSGLHGTTDSDFMIRVGGAYVPLIRQGEWWRLFTAMFLHMGMQHLLNNMMLLFAVGTLIENELGHVRYLIIYLVSGTAANYISYLWYLKHSENVVAVGASGAIFALVGAIIWILIRNKGHFKGLTTGRMIFAAAMMLYFGFTTPGVGNMAHVSGLIVGFLMTLILYRKN